MKKTSVLRYGAIAMASLGIAGIAAASTVTVGTSGPQSNQQTTLNNTNTVKTSTHNNVGLANISAQGSSTGSVKASDNTSVGGANGSGNAMNNSTTTTVVTVTNPSSGAAGSGMAAPNDTVSYNLTGPQSNQQTTINNTNKVETKTTNNVEVLNLTLQSAKSGKVEASDNTTVGGLSSGNATNSSVTTTTISLNN